MLGDPVTAKYSSPAHFYEHAINPVAATAHAVSISIPASRNLDSKLDSNPCPSP